MSVSITITPAVVALAVYIVGALMTASAFCLDEMSFVNPSYGRAILSGLAWPLLVVQVLILAPVFDIYIGDVLSDTKEWWKQFQCDHEQISECGDYEVNGRVGDEICRDCGKVWWEE